MKVVRFLSAIIILSLNMLTGCSNQLDESLIGTEACSPPCVLGIQPGVTQTSDAVQRMKEFEASGNGELTELESGTFRWRVSNTNYYLYSDGSRIKRINLQPKSATLEGVIGLFGEPTNLVLGKIGNGYYIFVVFYPEKGLCFLVGGDQKDFLIYPEMQVARADFLKPSDLPTMIDSLYGENAVGEILATMQDWKGYGKFDREQNP